MVVQGRHERELRPPLDVDKGTVVRGLVAEHAAQAEPLRAAAAFGDDVGDLPAFAALVGATDAADADAPLTAVRVAAVDTESPAAVAAAADLTVAGAAGAVALLRDCWPPPPRPPRRSRPRPDKSAPSGRQLVGPPVGRRPPAHRGAQRSGTLQRVPAPPW